MIAPAAWHQISAEEVFAQLKSAPLGLDAAEATNRLAAHGPNILPDAKRRPLSAVVLRQFASPLIYILFVAAASAFIV